MRTIYGKDIAENIYREIREKGGTRSLGIIIVGGDEASRQFVRLKQKKGVELGVDVRVYEFDAAETTRSLRKKISELVRQTHHQGFVIQLPLPAHLNAQYLLNAIPETKDVDCLNQHSLGALAVGRERIMPPVVGAVTEILKEAQVALGGKKIVLIGLGRLVGKPLALWFASKQIPFAVITENSVNREAALREADIVISGTGNPGLISCNLFKDGVLAIDCGTAQEAGSLKGDIDISNCASRDITVAPVPGGVGPITVAYIFKNLFLL